MIKENDFKSSGKEKEIKLRSECPINQSNHWH